MINLAHGFVQRKIFTRHGSLTLKQLSLRSTLSYVMGIEFIIHNPRSRHYLQSKVVLRKGSVATE